MQYNAPMFPELFSIGPFALRSLNVMLIIALVVTSFVFYRKVREEHFSEMEAFDAFLISLIIGLVISRLTFVAVHFAEFGWQIWLWADVVTHPGTIGSIGLVAAGWYLFHSAKRFTSDSFQLMDIWSIAVSTGLGIVWLGLLLDGSAYGNVTELPIGMVFPGLIERHIPIQLGLAIFFWLLAWYLNWVEYRYRTFSWYRSGKTSAQSGFLLAVSMIAISACYLIVSWFRPAQLDIFSLPLDSLLATAGMLFGIGILFKRSGRVILSGKRKV